MGCTTYLSLLSDQYSRMTLLGTDMTTSHCLLTRKSASGAAAKVTAMLRSHGVVAVRGLSVGGKEFDKQYFVTKRFKV